MNEEKEMAARPIKLDGYLKATLKATLLTYKKIQLYPSETLNNGRNRPVVTSKRECKSNLQRG